MGAHGPWAFLAFASQGIGLLLVFVGTLVMVVAGSVPANCFTSTCNIGNTDQGIAYGIETARLLWTLGLFAIAGGAGIRLQFFGPSTTTATQTPESTRIYLARRRGEFVILVVSIVLLFVLLVWSTGTFVGAA
jgi:hypothetical protein